MKGTFFIDFLAFFPFYNVVSSIIGNDKLKESEGKGSEMYNYIELLFLLRLLRLYKAAELLDPHYIFSMFRNFHGSWIKYLIRRGKQDKNLFLH